MVVCMFVYVGACEYVGMCCLRNWKQSLGKWWIEKVILHTHVHVNMWLCLIVEMFTGKGE